MSSRDSVSPRCHQRGLRLFPALGGVGGGAPGAAPSAWPSVRPAGPLQVVTAQQWSRGGLFRPVQDGLKWNPQLGPSGRQRPSPGKAGLPAFVRRQPRLPCLHRNTHLSTAAQPPSPALSCGPTSKTFKIPLGLWQTASGLEPSWSPFPASVSPSVAWVCLP